MLMNIVNDLRQWSPLEGFTKADEPQQTFFQRAMKGLTQGVATAGQDVKHAAENIRENVASFRDTAANIREGVAYTGSKLKDKVSDIHLRPQTVPQWATALGIGFWWAPGVMTTLFNCALITAAVQSLGWALHSSTDMVAHHEALGILNIVGLAIYSFIVQPGSTIRQWLLTGCVTFWGLRLCAFLVDRFKDEGVDRALAKIRTRKGRAMLWLSQAAWVFVTALPVIISNAESSQKASWNRPAHYDKLVFRDYVGFALWAFGFVFETIADWQKAQFRKRPLKEGEKPFIDFGLWKYSRHPNYFGEICMWIGIYIASGTVLHGWQHIAALSPALMAFLLRFVTGVPRVEAQADRAFGDNQSYQAYKKRTPLILPFL